jgi:hypothetical protein
MSCKCSFVRATTFSTKGSNFRSGVLCPCTTGSLPTTFGFPFLHDFLCLPHYPVGGGEQLLITLLQALLTVLGLALGRPTDLDT